MITLILYTTRQYFLSRSRKIAKNSFRYIAIKLFTLKKKEEKEKLIPFATMNLGKGKGVILTSRTRASCFRLIQLFLR